MIVLLLRCMLLVRMLSEGEREERRGEGFILIVNEARTKCQVFECGFEQKYSHRY
jgi:hypothetical protein